LSRNPLPGDHRTIMIERSAGGNMGLGDARRHICARLAEISVATVAAAAMSCFLACASWAATEGRELPSDQRLRTLVDKWHCPVADYLERIHRVSQKLQDRYLILWAKRHPEFYVQCIFHDEDRQIYCEAASGFFLYADKIGNFATPQRLAALERLGFSTDGSKGNFSQERDFHNADELAILMIETLARVFEFDTRDVLEFNAPFLSKRRSNHVKVGTACAPISALNPIVASGSSAFSRVASPG
jgi:hypothetical protein